MIATYETINELIESLDSVSSFYDTEAMEIDYHNNNLSLNCPDIERYYKPYIVAQSYINGQIKQARSQFKQWNLCAAHLNDYLTSEQIISLAGI